MGPTNQFYLSILASQPIAIASFTSRSLFSFFVNGQLSMVNTLSSFIDHLPLTIHH